MTPLNTPTKCYQNSFKNVWAIVFTNWHDDMHADTTTILQLLA